MTKLATESLAMRFFKKIGFNGIAWSLRRLYCPVDKDALVLEVGSGGNPYARANVLLDAYEATEERFWVPLKADRPMILGFAEKMPFKNDAFDFVIASHVLEHSSNAGQFLSELQRVARAGYIEVPDSFMERINPYEVHRLEVTCREDKLVIRNKPAWVVERDTVELYENRVKHLLTTETIPKHPFEFHVRYYWKDKIDFIIVNPEVNAAWAPVDTAIQNSPPSRNCKNRLRGLLLDLLRTWLSQTRRNNRLDLISLLICPTCGSDSLSKSANSILCNKCRADYSIRDGIPAMYPQEKR